MPRRWMAALGLLLLVAVGVRLPVVADPYSSFHPTRQYRDAVVARDLAYSLWGAPTEEKQAAASAVMVGFGPKEPPLVEWVAAAVRVDEAQDWWRIRILIAAGYLAGVVWLVACVGRRLGRASAVAAMVVGAVLPYLVHATASFQPDPLVVALLCGGYGLLLVGRSPPDARTCLAVGALGGVAGLMKPTALPVLLVPYLLITWRSWRQAPVLGGAALLVLPPVLWAAVSLVLGDSLDSHASSSIVPELLLEGSFWQQWLARIDDVFGVVVVAAALLGGVLGEARIRALVLGGAVGYVMVGLTFTHHMASHDYYHLIFVPVVMIGWGSLVLELPKRIATVRPAILALPAVALAALMVVESVRVIDWHLDSGADRTAAVAMPYTFLSVDEAVTFTRDDGLGLEYLTWASVLVWPNAADVAFRQQGGEEVVVGRALLDEHIADGVEWFVFAVPADAARVPDLVDLLAGFPVAACTPDGIVVDLRAEESERGAVRACLGQLDLAVEPS